MHTTKLTQNGFSCICEQDYTFSVPVSVTQLSMEVLLSQKTEPLKEEYTKKHNL